MTAYRNDDPPDYPEPPECCGEEMDVDGQCLVCATCGRREEIIYDDYPDPQPDPVEELPDDFYAGPEKCPHGNNWGDCDACDYLGDIAYDAARERR
jgi:hypothetical protein